MGNRACLCPKVTKIHRPALLKLGNYEKILNASYEIFPAGRFLISSCEATLSKDELEVMQQFCFSNDRVVCDFVN